MKLNNSKYVCLNLNLHNKVISSDNSFWKVFIDNETVFLGYIFYNADLNEHPIFKTPIYMSVWEYSNIYIKKDLSGGLFDFTTRLTSKSIQKCSSYKPITIDGIKLFMVTVDNKQEFYDVDLNKKDEYSIKILHNNNYIERTVADVKTLFKFDDGAKITSILDYKKLEERTVDTVKLLMVTDASDGVKFYKDSDQALNGNYTTIKPQDTKYIKRTVDGVKTLFKLDGTSITDYKELEPRTIDTVKLLMITDASDNVAFYNDNDQVLNKNYKSSTLHNTTYIEQTVGDVKTLFKFDDGAKITTISNYESIKPIKSLFKKKYLEVTNIEKTVDWYSSISEGKKDDFKKTSGIIKYQTPIVIGASVGSVSVGALITALILIIKKRKK